MNTKKWNHAQMRAVEDMTWAFVLGMWAMVGLFSGRWFSLLFPSIMFLIRLSFEPEPNQFSRWRIVSGLAILFVVAGVLGMVYL